MPEITSATANVLGRALSIGADPADEPDVRLRKSGLLLTAWSIAILATVWVLVYLALGRPVSAAIPFVYQVYTFGRIAWIARRGWNERFMSGQIVLMMVLPAVLMWTLGGFISGSVVILWAFLAPMGALVFAGLRQASVTFAVFVILVLVSGILDPWLSSSIEPLPDSVVRTFFVLNIVTVGFVAFSGYIYFVHQRDRAQSQLARALDDLDRERVRSDDLLRNILPDSVAERLKDGEVVADRYEAVTVVFADMVGFAALSAAMAPEDVVDLLDRVYGGLDELSAEHGLVRIKTMGDAYMAAAGVPDVMEPVAGARAAASMALAMLAHVAAVAPEVEVRVGIHSGPAVAGVIGRRTFAYDLWGDAVNIASRMESHGVPGQIQLSAHTCALLGDRFACHHRGRIDIKGLGRMDTYLLAPDVD